MWINSILDFIFPKSWGQTERRSYVVVKRALWIQCSSWSKPRFIYISCFLCVSYIQVVTLPPLQHYLLLCLRVGLSSYERHVWDVRTHMSDSHVSVCQPAFVYTSTVCRVEAGALLSQAITFTSTPNLSWVSRVRVKAEEVTARKWLLPHHKWERNRGNGSGKVVAVAVRCAPNMMVWMEAEKESNK